MSGRWPYVTSSPHAHWLVLNAVIDDPSSSLHGQPRFFILHSTDVTVESTWGQVAAMRSSGSDAVTAKEVFVSDQLVSGLDLKPLRIDRPLFRVSMFPLFVASASSVCLGIWRSAVESMISTTATKRSSTSDDLWIEIPSVQGVLGAAEADRRSYLAGALHEAAEVFRIAERGEVTPADRAAFWAVLLRCMDRARVSISRMYAASSTDTWVRGHRLEHALRDIHAINVAIERHRPRLEDAGRVLTGLEPTAPIF